MLTTCPECHTAFRVGQAQLDSRRGLVRCGRCNAVFNAYDSLLPELEAPSGEQPTPARGMPAHPAPDGLGQAGTHQAKPHAAAPLQTAAHAEDDFHIVLPDQVPQLVEPRAARAASLKDQPGAGMPVADRHAATLTRETAESILLSELPIHRPSDEPGTPAWKSAVWGIVAMGLALLLMMQLAYFMRAELASWLPEARPYLLQTCALLGCDVPLPQEIDALRIEASSLESNPDDKGRGVLRFSISNRADQAIAWPMILVSLTNTANQEVVRKLFLPTQYLPPGINAAEGIAAGQEQEVVLNLVFIGVDPFGYRIEKRYP